MFVRGQNGGGGSDEPYILFGHGNSGYVDVIIANNVAKKYKYVKMLTQADYQSFSGDSAIATYITTTSASLRIDNASSSVTLSTTPTLVSSLNMSDNQSSYLRVSSISTWTGFAAMFYND